MAAFIASVAVVAVAQASSGVVSYFRFNDLQLSQCQGSVCAAGAPRSFADADAIAINADGAGGGSAGDIYVVDRGGPTTFGRIQQFSAADDFIRLWGSGVVKSGPGNADEIQAVRVDATAGFFKLGFGANTTADIPAGASAAQVEAALNGLGSIGAGGVSVSGGPGNAGGTTPYVVSFDGGSLAGTDQPVLKATTGGTPLSGAGATVSAYTTRRGDVGFEICQPTAGDECASANDGGGFSSIRGSGLAGDLFSPRAIAMDQATGDLYVSNRNRIEAYSASGEFLRAWGQDVVASGPNDSTGLDEQKSVTVKATGGTFTLGYRRGFNMPTESTAPLPYDASPAVVEAALNDLAEIGGDYSSVTVTGGPGDLEGLSPYVITFHGLLGGDDLDDVLVTNSNGLTIDSGVKSAVVATVADGGGYEVCELDDACKVGVEATTGGAFGSGSSLSSVAVAPASTPNAGNVLTADARNNRMQEFTPNGAFVRAFGWDVVGSGLGEAAAPDEQQQVTIKADGGTFRLILETFNATAPIPYNATPSEVEAALEALLPAIGGAGASVTVTGGPGNLTGANPYVITFDGSLSGDDILQLTTDASNLTISSGVKSAAVKTLVGGGAFEVCSAADGDICDSGTLGTGVGQFGNLAGVTEDSGGAIYTVEQKSNFSSQPAAGRVQKFTPSGGLDLTPSLFGTTEAQELIVNASAGNFRLTLGAEYEGTHGTAVLVKGSTVMTDVKTTKGLFAVGQSIRTNGGSLEQNTFITAIGPGTLTLSKPIAFGTSTDQDFNEIFSRRPYTTPDIPYNASASEVESALNSLPSINSGGGSVSVSGGPGDPTGSSPYVITFDGEPLARSDLFQTVASQGSPALSGGSGAGASTASVVTSTPGGPSGNEPLSTSFEFSTPFDIAIAPGDRVLVAKGFPQTQSTCADGLPSTAESRIMELDTNGVVLGLSDPCEGVRPSSESENASPALTVNRATGHAYLLGGLGSHNVADDRVNIFGPPGPTPDVALDPVSNISPTGGTIAGTINPNGPGTSYPDVTGTPSSYRTAYRVEYKKASESEWTKYSPDIPIGSGVSPVGFSVGVGDLAPKTPYELKVVATKPFTGAVEEIESFTTAPAPPEIESFSSSNVTASSADLHAQINPQGTETTYHFEYGTTTAYGQSTPETSIGEALNGQAVTDHIEGLEDAVYHFRVVATNALGTTTSEDQTFNFHPPVCPNQTVRQQTGAAYLPDCRAYELVSPEDAGGTVLYTGGPQSPYASNPPRLAFVGQLAAIPNSGRNPINTMGDLYLATRGSSNWTSRYIGPSAEEAGCVGGRPIVSGTGYATTIQNDVMATPSLDRLIDWNLGNPVQCFNGINGSVSFSDFNTAAVGSNAPYVWNANGDFLDRWPTSAGDVAGAEEDFSCPQGGAPLPVGDFCKTLISASKDLNHFVFSTQSGLFGQGGLTKAPGSAYDNNTAEDTLSLVSELGNGEPIGQEPGAKAGPEELIQFPAVSADGSHILMGTAPKPACKQGDFPGKGPPLAGPLCPIITQPTHLYMRVNDAVTYDVSGKAVKYIGSTPDATKVYFTSAEQLTGDDTDQSTDLFMWSENGGAPQLTRISAGEPAPSGNTDNCVSTWTTECDVETYDDSRISTTYGSQGGAGSWDVSNPNPSYTDNAIAAGSGDIYFYSPEQLVQGEGAPGKENLYVYRGGSVRHVATLEDDPYCIHKQAGSVLGPTCSNGAVGRLQVTPDGRYAAFITTSRITGYDNQGFAEMYRYAADTEKLECMSCRPDGSAPADDVLGSQAGRFITDDGRVFFATTEPLEARDTNGGIDSEGFPTGIDVYEFVDGRPQLITSGTGIGTAGNQITRHSFPGLYGVSADGVDVYFGTFDTLVGQDRNGAQLKFYDARTNGGFPFVPPPLPCAAADECRGPSAPAPGPVTSGTSTALGSGGNARQAKQRKRKQQKRKQRKAKKAKKAARERSVHHGKGGNR